ncbi:hypothetical protein [Qingshengfaniella alkalisoli]|uniref:Uncharacterized protein n=1 Tax=Qingshengfaniella alkalisoli TaxID=2599296 RepID=A0A5B8J5V2_9RHOB|nr:hypothetical protein [Qingshengfaniella alkalisoli]QDY69710.1 hypothetical protein FPZ52_08805 [Qingshengfaniella alkalisoli]
MMQFLRLAALLLGGLAILYVCLFFYLRAGKRERLEADYPESATDREREAFVKSAVDAYSSRIAPWLALVVFGLPLTGLAVYIYVTNFM